MSVVQAPVVLQDEVARDVGRDKDDFLRLGSDHHILLDVQTQYRS